MKVTPIICSGAELESVLADIRSRGGFVESLDTCVGGKNAQYGVKYFDRFPFACGDCDPCLGGRPDQCVIFPTEDAPERVEKRTGIAVAGSDKRAEKPKSITDAPASIYGSGPNKAGAGSSRTPLGQLTAAIPTNFERVKTVPSTDRRPTGEMRDGDDGGVRPALDNLTEKNDV